MASLPGQKTSLTLGTCYCPPNQTQEGNQHLENEVKEASKKERVVIMGDFNYPHIDWVNSCSTYEREITFLDMLNNLQKMLCVCLSKCDDYFTIYPFFLFLLISFFPAVLVTVDQETAHPRLSVSENQRRVTGGEKCQNLPFTPERFDKMSCVLGCEKFTAGRHYWDVEIEGTRAGWAVGVARESVRRKGYMKFSPEEGIWAIQYLCTSEMPFFQLSASQTKLSLSKPLSRVQVSLDYKAGLVAFSDPCSGRSIFTFSFACFSGERVCPFFWVPQICTLNCC
uniref:B30.2/SPRY domain-containing protein n=1 Tax=Salvator merianae TaxID=96440 RepID=A0A8D0BHT0_SALMN